MTRHELREEVFKLLFRVEFNSKEDMPEQVRLFLENTETLVKEKDASFVKERYEKIRDCIPKFDAMIAEKCEGWDVNRIGKVELTVLRVALYEIFEDESIPEGVAVNEAVEIAKSYGAENSGSFVNGVLSKFLK